MVMRVAVRFRLEVYRSIVQVCVSGIHTCLVCLCTSVCACLFVSVCLCDLIWCIVLLLSCEYVYLGCMYVQHHFDYLCSNMKIGFYL